MRYYIALAVAVSVFGASSFTLLYPVQADKLSALIKSAGSQAAAAFASQVTVRHSKSVATLQSKYDSAGAKEKVRVLIVPGHEPSLGGTQFGPLKERDLVVVIAEELAELLSRMGKYEVTLTRDSSGWTPGFDAYFTDNWDEIIAWRQAHKAEELRLISAGQKDRAEAIVIHNKAPSDVAYRLHGINKWANENNMDIVIHIHLNDYPRSDMRAEGKYTGFSIYVPEPNYNNSTTTVAVARNVFARLGKYNPVTNLPVESGGIIEEPDLIAVGTDNSLDAPSMLIEYGYIYETQFVEPEIRRLSLRELAFHTYLGLEDFFSRGKSRHIYDTTVLPYLWKEVLKEGVVSTDAFALQTALIFDGVYPPAGEIMNDCPRTGKIGECTKASLKQFQRKYKLKETGLFDKETIEHLNRLYAGEYVRP